MESHTKQHSNAVGIRPNEILSQYITVVGNYPETLDACVHIHKLTDAVSLCRTQQLPQDFQCQGHNISKGKICGVKLHAHTHFSLIGSPHT